MERRFKLVCVLQGSGWPSGHVAIDHFVSWSDTTGGQEICLNHDTENASELVDEIDRMIAELKSLREQVPERFAQWKRLFDQAI